MSMPNLFDDATRARMRALYSARAPRSDAWHDRQLAHAKACLAEADKQHTPEEIAAAKAALAVDPRCPQETLFNAPPSRDLLPGEMPRPAAGGCALSTGPLEFK